MEYKEPKEIFHEALEELWDDESCMEYGYFMLNSSRWRLGDGRIFKVTFEETSVIAI